MGPKKSFQEWDAAGGGGFRGGWDAGGIGGHGGKCINFPNLKDAI